MLYKNGKKKNKQVNSAMPCLPCLHYKTCYCVRLSKAESALKMITFKENI